MLLSISDVLSLELLNLENSGLTGPIPSAIGNLTLLWNIGLMDNNLTGMVPFFLFCVSPLFTIKIVKLQVTYDYKCFNCGRNNSTGDW